MYVWEGQEIGIRDICVCRPKFLKLQLVSCFDHSDMVVEEATSLLLFLGSVSGKETYVLHELPGRCVYHRATILEWHFFQEVVICN